MASIFVLSPKVLLINMLYFLLSIFDCFWADENNFNKVTINIRNLVWLPFVKQQSLYVIVCFSPLCL